MFKTLKSFQFLIYSIFLQSLSFLFIKYASISENSFFYIFILFAFIALAVRAFFWQKVLSLYSLAKVYPYNSLVLILLLFYSVVLFNETLNYHHILGTILIISGIFLISKEKK